MPPKIYTETPLEKDKYEVNKNGFRERVIPAEDAGHIDTLVKAIKEAKNPINRRPFDFPWLDPDVLWFLDLALAMLHHERPALFKKLQD